MAEYIEDELKRFNYLTNEIDAAYHEAALKLGLSDSAMLILYTICNNGEECLLSDITKLSGISKQTLNSALRKLEGEEIVYLEKFSGKKKRICLTEKGRLLVKETVYQLIKIENDIFDSWTKEERRSYIALTERYLSSFKNKIKEL
ncbi:MAG: MarR family transcriptional regulator [Lachnospiraceae bacterium]|nr:MarR family transcriptional regulator [Lachnospiraceae bacterium]